MEHWLAYTLARLAAIGITLFLPALYIAILSFHPGMIPFKLVFSIVASRKACLSLL